MSRRTRRAPRARDAAPEERDSTPEERDSTPEERDSASEERDGTPEEGSAPDVSGETGAEPSPPGGPAKADDSRLSPTAHLVAGLAMPLALVVACMWRLRQHTVDDAYISYRYARHLAAGLGLVFNEGERIEGYTNFLFTCLLAGAIKLGADPDHAAKVIGGLSACGSIALMYAISARLWPLRAVPVLATWLLAGSAVTAGYAMFGLETSFFVFLLLLATWLFLRERDRPAAFPWSGAALALAGLTRPEAPMFAGLLMLFLAGEPVSASERGAAFAKAAARGAIRGLFGRRNLIRAALFLVPIAAHLAFRKAYYDAWLPNTFAAKTGNIDQQLHGGFDYVSRYARHAGPFLALALGGVWLALARRRGDLAVLAVIAIAVVVYVVLVGGDWMPLFRFMAAFEPFCFLLAGVFVRWVVDTKGRAAALAIGVFAIYTAWHRGRAFTDAARQTDDERTFWTSSAGGVADWLVANGERGTVAVGDMGYIAYATDYPILDLLGLVDPVISKLPGGYTNKTGPGYVERVFQVMPRYFVFVGSADGCARLPFQSQARLRNDRRFRGRYEVLAQIRHSKGGFWCIFGAR